MAKKIARLVLEGTIIIGVVFIVFNFPSFWIVVRFHFQASEEGARVEYPAVIVGGEPEISISRLGIQAPIMEADGMDPPAILEALKRGVVRDPVSSGLNQNRIILIGHSSALPWQRGEYGSVFALLGQARIGDEIVVSDVKEPYRFRVTGQKIINISGYGSTNQEEITADLVLVTCWPIGTTQKRLVVLAKKTD